jgi:hypothetical protein
MSVLADDDVVVHRDTKRAGRFHDRLRHVDVRPRRGRVSRRMVVDQYNGRGREFERAAHHLARIDRRVVHRAAALHLVGDQRVALVEEEDADVFLDIKNLNSSNVLAETSSKRPRRVPHSSFSVRFSSRIWATRLVCLSVPRL